MKRLWSLFLSCFLWVVLTPYALIFMGAASNQIVMIANHDSMPVLVNQQRLAEFTEGHDVAEGMLDNRHSILTNESHLVFLADIFDFHDSIESVGDMLLDAGSGLEYPCFIAWLTLIIYTRKVQ